MPSFLKEIMPTQFYVYKGNPKSENDFFSTQSFPVMLSGAVT
ncbi:MAG: hypothetical protein JWQ30_2635 [Sediminibacterium sp.]|nr:hypothetical protein [Sediminibacterium sp.]